MVTRRAQSPPNRADPAHTYLAGLDQIAYPSDPAHTYLAGLDQIAYPSHTYLAGLDQIAYPSDPAHTYLAGLDQIAYPSYLGTGYAFGIHRLAETFETRLPTERPVHVLIITDHDIFAMLGEKRGETEGWDVARSSLETARGGGTYVLHMASNWASEHVQRMRSDGWDVVFVHEWQDVVKFAEDFSRKTYQGT